MSKLRRNIIPAVAIVGLAVSLVLLYQARASLRDRDEQVQHLRRRMAQLEDDVHRHSAAHPTGLTADELEAYLALPYKEFDVIYGSGHRRFRDQPRDPVQVAALIEAYFNRHTELPFDARATLQSHAAQMFAFGGMNERAIAFLDRLLADNSADSWADATKAFLLFDRAGLLAVRRRMAGGATVRLVDFLIDHFGESYFDVCKWEPVGSTVSVPAGASANHRATAEQLATAFGLPVTFAPDPPAERSSPAECIRLEIRSMEPWWRVPGYIILHLNKSTLITATDEQRLAAAVTRFIETSREYDGKRQAPIGLATSFELAR
jgi:hypothetical protein